MTFEDQYFLLFFYMSAYALVEWGITILESEFFNAVEEEKFELEQS